MKSTEPAVSFLKSGRYQVLSVLGAGGFGITYLCRDNETWKLCAVKEYMPDNIAARERATKDILPAPEKKNEYLHGKKRFCEEAVLLSKMQKLSCIVRIRDLFEEHNTAYFVMDYIEGKTLKQLIRENGGKLPMRTALNITLQCANALERVHKQIGIFHRDISPENIMVLSDGTARIIDFGNAKALSVSSDQQFSVVLKPGFAPPEQYSSTMRQGSFTDVYSLASTFYYAASGHKIPAAPARLAGESHLPLHDILPSCSKKISDAVERALLLDPEKRTQTMEAFIEEINAGLKKGSIVTPGGVPETAPARKSPAGEGEKKESPGRRHPGNRIPPEKTGKEIRNIDRTQPDAPPSVWVLPETGRWAGKLFPVPLDSWVSIGRNAGKSTIAMSGHKEISGLHLYLYFDTVKRRFIVMDRSTNGTYYGPYRLTKNRKYAVLPGTRLMIGSRMCTILLGESYDAV